MRRLWANDEIREGVRRALPMSFWKWIKVYFTGYTLVIAIPDKHYRIVLLKGYPKLSIEKPELRGRSFDMVYYDEESR